MLPDASRITEPPTIIAIIKYDNDVKRIASSVPFGIAVCGSYRIQDKIYIWHETSALTEYKFYIKHSLILTKLIAMIKKHKCYHLSIEETIDHSTEDNFN